MFAQYLGVSQRAVEQWESGVKRPMGSSAKLLLLVARKGLQHIA